VTGDYTKTPIRCTQNPTMGEEWRKGWHPERIRKKERDAQILVIGAGPAGLEAGRALGQRGYQVTIADAASEAGGRVARECRLPGLSAWGRVRDWRLLQIGKMANVDLYLESELNADTALEFGADQIVCATGAKWRRDGAGHHQYRPVAVDATMNVLTPDDLMSGNRPSGGEAVIFDDDHYYMASVLAELLVKSGTKVTYVTPASVAAAYTANTMEQKFIQARLIELGVAIRTCEALSRVTAEGLAATCVYTGRARFHETANVVLVTSRKADDALYRDLKQRGAPVTAIGDAWAPAAIVHAVYAGRRFAEEFDLEPRDVLDVPFRREMIALAAD
jgi:dimethylamine/trimethylamine dehydrogenase